MSILSLRSAVTTAGGTPTQFTHVGLLRELITAWGGTPTYWSVNELLRQAITTKGGTPTKFRQVELLRDLVTQLGGSPATYDSDALLAQVATLSTGGAAATMSLNFVTGTYTVSGTGYGSLASIPGYSYARTGSLTVVDSDATIDTFTANTVPINGNGLHSYAALTNLITQSQNILLGQGPWFSANITTTTDTTVAPDGTTTADTQNMTGTGHTLQAAGLALTTGQVYSFSFFALRGTATDAKLSVHDGTADLIAATSYYSQTNGSTFSRIIQAFTPVRTSNHGCYPLRDSGVTGTMILWQAQLIAGNLPDGGPIIPTTTTTVTTGTPTLSITFPNGTYNVTYTFADNTTQVVSQVVSSNLFTVSTAPTLNRGRIKSIVI